MECDLYLDETESKDEKTIVKMQPSRYLAVRLMEKEGIALDNDDKCKPTSTTVKLWITSLNSHPAEI